MRTNETADYTAKYFEAMAPVAVYLEARGHSLELGTRESAELTLDGVVISAWYGPHYALQGLLKTNKMRLSFVPVPSIRARTFKTAESRGWELDIPKVANHLLAIERVLSGSK